MFEKRAMLVELTIRQWTARKHDKRATNEVHENHGAHGAGRFNKQLIGRDALESISRQGKAIRLFHYAHTLPWGNNGQRLLPATLFLEYRSKLAAMVREFDACVAHFLASYPRLIQEARLRLGTLYEPEDYPPTEEIERAFGVTFEIFPVPTAGDFRVEVANEERSEIVAQIEETARERQTQATKACYVRVRDVLQRMKQQCVEGKTRVTSSLMEDVRSLAGMLDDLNIAGDPALTQLAADIRQDLVFDADDLRKDPQLRKAAGDRAADLLDSFSWGATWGG